MQWLVKTLALAQPSDDPALAMEFADLHAEFSKRLAKEMRAVPADSPESSQSMAQVPHLEGSHA